MAQHTSVSLKRVLERFAKAKTPPNLREAKDGLRSCATCSAFDLEKGSCRSYGNHPVTPIQTCDTWHVEADAS